MLRGRSSSSRPASATMSTSSSVTTSSDAVNPARTSPTSLAANPRRRPGASPGSCVHQPPVGGETLAAQACHSNHLRLLKPVPARSEEHTSELQSRENLVCRLLLEKKKKKKNKQ